MEKKASKGTKLSRYLKAPIRALIRAKNSYIDGMTQCAGRFEYATTMAGPTAPQVCTLPKSFSVNSTKSGNKEDLAELMRAASTRNLSKKVELELLQRRLPTGPGGGRVVPRSRSLGIGRIDEEKTCEFEVDVKVNSTAAVYPRSRSYAVPKRAGAGML
ncbi:uncharacterized protein LOC127809990 [Diospyros lotus]|uniref:uncharacterized protein LOC127809990 n=1 Tax=Diospyros lotus TaxID=55363 RepID=UPI00225898E2|nr:uncharacterized protein LOC127809990 [Diospyros lotus]